MATADLSEIVQSCSCFCLPDSDASNSRSSNSINFSRPNQHRSEPPAVPDSCVTKAPF